MATREWYMYTFACAMLLLSAIYICVGHTLMCLWSDRCKHCLRIRKKAPAEPLLVTNEPMNAA